MAITLMEQEQKRLLKKFHTLLGKAGLGADEKEAILAGYGVESSKELTAYELLEACNQLDKMSNPKAAEMDKWRKRVIASIFSYFGALGLQSDMNRVKGTAARAARAETFNDIPLEQLRTLYSAFSKKAKTVEHVDIVTEDIINELKLLN
ncbi:MAG TPA: hypothetical protein GXZ87_07535 [Bacteroidales bacterium]|nr:hypothetical protein [Bacteroidales bacterium]